MVVRNLKGFSARSNKEAAFSSTFQEQSKPKEQLITYSAFNFHVVLPIFIVCLSPDLICGIKVAANMEIIVNTVCA